MDRKIRSELQLLSKELRGQFDPDALEKMGKVYGFVQRKSKFGTQQLAALCIWLSQRLASDSLVQLCGVLEAETGIQISPEGLNQRLNSNAAEVLIQIFRALLQSKLNPSENSIACNQVFNRIRITDSTSFQLPDSFALTYLGSGGSSNTAGVKIHLEYDLLSGKFMNVFSGEGSKNDKTYGKSCLASIESGDLFLRELGYFDLGDLAAIAEHNAYFVSRIKLNTRVYVKNTASEVFQDGSIKKQSEYTQIHLGVQPTNPTKLTLRKILGKSIY